MRPPARLHHIGLRREGGKTGRRAAALYVDEDAGRLGHCGVADVFCHEGEARPGGHGESLGSSPNRPLQSNGGREFVFHLNEGSADGWYSCGEAFDNFRGRRDGISCSKSRTGSERTFAAGMVAIDEVHAGEDAARISLHLPPRRPCPPWYRKWRSPGNTCHTNRIRCISRDERRVADGSPWN